MWLENTLSVLGKSLTKFKFNPKLDTHLQQCKLLLLRLNQDSDLEIPKVFSLLNKDCNKNQDKEIYAVFESLLLLNKKIYNYQDVELDSWYKYKLDAASEHTFLIFNYLSEYDQSNLEKYIINFYYPNDLKKE